jgi:hypothetical protein
VSVIDIKFFGSLQFVEIPDKGKLFLPLEVDGVLVTDAVDANGAETKKRSLTTFP